jgi:hypothetical protein
METPAAAHDGASAAASPCCSGESVPVVPPTCPEHEEDCSCPTRDAALLAKSASTDVSAPAAPETTAPAVTPPGAGTIAFAGLSFLPRHYPPPKSPLHRTFRVLLC